MSTCEDVEAQLIFEIFLDHAFMSLFEVWPLKQNLSEKDL